MFTLSINIILNIGLKKRKGVESNVQLLLNPLSVTKTAGVPACLLFMYLFVFYLFNLFCGIVLEREKSNILLFNYIKNTLSNSRDIKNTYKI